MTTRIFASLDETNPLKPVPCVQVNGQEVRLSLAEFDSLITEMIYLREAANKQLSGYYKQLARKYVEVSNAK